jgi:predicted dinucleotide-binding enzyme
MKIGVLGTGDVGKSLAKAFLALGHEVKMGARTANNENAQAFAKEAGQKASAGSFADTASFADVVVLCTLGMAYKEVLEAAGLDNLRGKLLIDTTNPLDFSTGKPALGITGNDSAGERIQKLVPEARVVKAFNTVGNTLMFRPQLPGGPPDMFICGDNDEAKKQTAALLKDFGWEVIDLGGIESSRYLEAMCIVWVQAAMRLGTWTLAYKMLRK